jgi:hypothetical protein
MWDIHSTLDKLVFFLESGVPDGWELLGGWVNGGLTFRLTFAFYF